MADEAAFLEAIRTAPADGGHLLVYADWLEDRGDPAAAAKVEFLRLTVQAEASARPRLQQLAADLDPAWLALVSRLAIENCAGKRAKAEQRRMHAIRFDYLCDRRWEGLQPTADPGVRYCDACAQNVHYCATITEAREHAWKRRCIAVDLGVIRRERDLGPEVALLGRPSVESLLREQERRQPDAVSAAREERKRAAAAGGADDAPA